MNSEKLLDSFNKHCWETDDCEHCKYNCANESDILECGIWYGYNKAIDDFEYACVQMIKEEQDTRYGYLDGMDIREIAKKLKAGGKVD